MKKTAIFAAGCFWHVEHSFLNMPGIIKTTVGYTGGKTKNPSYEQLGSGETGHAEAVEIIFDPKKITYEQLLNHFWMIHNPTTINRQGPDIGTNYRSTIFYFDETQKKAAEKSKKEMQEKLEKPIVTEIKKASKFYPAEGYHQKYFQRYGKDSCLMRV